jgi:hypothetical protein
MAKAAKKRDAVTISVRVRLEVKKAIDRLVKRRPDLVGEDQSEFIRRLIYEALEKYKP